MKLNKEIEIELPHGPNYIRLKRKPGFTESEAAGFSIDQFTDQELKDIGDAMTANLIERARTMRKAKK